MELIRFGNLAKGPRGDETEHLRRRSSLVEAEVGRTRDEAGKTANCIQLLLRRDSAAAGWKSLAGVTLSRTETRPEEVNRKEQHPFSFPALYSVLLGPAGRVEM